MPPANPADSSRLVIFGTEYAENAERNGLFRSSGVTGVTLRLGVQTNDAWCVIVPVGTRRALSEDF